MNLMFRKNFAGDKGLGGGGGGEARTNYSSSVSGPSGAASRLGGARAGARGPVRRSREFGYYPMDHEATSHSYRTHLFLSPPTGGNQGSSNADDAPETRLGPGPRKSSGAVVIKWGGTSNNNNINNNASAAQASLNNINVKRKQLEPTPPKDVSQPPTPTASRQVLMQISFFLQNTRVFVNTKIIICKGVVQRQRAWSIHTAGRVRK